MRRRGGLSLLAALALLCPAGPALAVPEPRPLEFAIPPHQEAAVLRWLLPLRLDRAVADGWLLRDVAILGDALTLTVAAPTGEPRLPVRVTRQAGGGSHLAVACDPMLPRAVCDRIGAVIGEAPESLQPWRPVHPPPPFQWPSPLRWPRPLVLALWLALAVLGVRELRTALAARPLTSTETWSTWGLVLAAIAVRLTWAPRTLLHELYKSALATEFLLDGTLAHYGEAIQAPALVLDALTGAGVESLFAVNLLASIAAVPAMLLLDCALFGRRPEAWLGAVAVALLPLHVRFAACEEVWPASLALIAVSLAAWRQFLREPRPARLAVATVAMALLVQMRPEWLLLPLAHAALVLAAPDRVPLRRLPWLALGLAATVLAAVALPQLAAIGPGQPLQLPRPHVLALWAPLDPAGTSPALSGLLALGAAAALTSHHRRFALFLLGLHVALTLLEFSFFSTAGPYAQRVQLVPHALLMPFLGVAAAALRRWVPSPLALALPLLVCCLQLATRLDVVIWRSALQAEWDFQREAVPLLPTPIRLIARAGPGNVDAFPTFLLARAAKVWTQFDPIEIHTRQQWPQPGAELIVYLGMTSWLYGDELHDVDLPRRACEDVRQRYQLTPIATRDLAPVAYPPIRHHPPGRNGWRVGFYRATTWRVDDGGGP